MAGGSLSSFHLGQHIIIVGLFSQIVFFGFFLLVAITFHWRISRNPTFESLYQPRSFIYYWKTLLYALYAASGLILVRSIFRTIEYIQGNAGYLLRHELYLYVFDALLMLAVMIIFNVEHPSHVFPRSGKRNGTELESWQTPSRESEVCAEDVRHANSQRQGNA